MDAKSVAPKRQLFKKPAWSIAESTNSRAETPDDLFRHSSHSYSDIVAEENKRRERRQAKKEQKRLSDGITAEVNGPKRRRVSLEEDDSGGGSGDDSPFEEDAKPQSNNPKAEKSPATPETRVPRPSTSRSKSSSPIVQAVPVRTATPVKIHSSVVIDLNEEKPELSAKGEIRITKVQPRAKTQRKDEDSSDDDDEYTKELKRRARENAERKRQKVPLDDTTTTLYNSDFTLREASRSQSTAPHRGPSRPKEDDIKVDILITSEIPNTKPVRITRLLSQNLGQVRKAWCQRCGLSEDMTAKVFLTWRGKRVFDVTTCKGMGIRPTTDDFLLDDEVSRARAGERIAMEATTEEIFEQQKRRREASYVEDEEEQEEGDQSESPLPVEEAASQEELRVVLKSPGLEELKAKVRPNTTIMKVMTVFKKQRGIADNKQVYLLFDGERLEPDSTVGDCDIADLDAIDVLIR